MKFQQSHLKYSPESNAYPSLDFSKSIAIGGNLFPDDYKYYIYAYLDPTRPGIYNYGGILFKYEPFYIGKGKEERWSHHFKQAAGVSKKKDNNYHKLGRISRLVGQGTPPIVVRVFSDLTCESALLIESVLIQTIGRRDNQTGYLSNLTDGGDGANNFSKETREKISNSLKGKTAWNKGKTGVYTDEARDRISKTLTGRKGIPLTEYQKDCVSKTHKGKVVSDETKKKQSESHKGQVAWNKGKKMNKPPWNKGLTYKLS